MPQLASCIWPFFSGFSFGTKSISVFQSDKHEAVSTTRITSSQVAKAYVNISHLLNACNYQASKSCSNYISLPALILQGLQTSMEVTNTLITATQLCWPCSHAQSTLLFLLTELMAVLRPAWHSCFCVWSGACLKCSEDSGVVGQVHCCFALGMIISCYRCGSLKQLSAWHVNNDLPFSPADAEPTETPKYLQYDSSSDVPFFLLSLAAGWDALGNHWNHSNTHLLI